MPLNDKFCILPINNVILPFLSRNLLFFLNGYYHNKDSKIYYTNSKFILLLSKPYILPLNFF